MWPARDFLSYLQPIQSNRAKAQKQDTIVNKFETFLSKVGTKAKQVVSYIINTALPGATKVAQLAEPIVDLAEPSIGPEFNLVVNAAAATEAGWAIANQGTGTGPQKLAEVLATVKADLLPTLTATGLETTAAEAIIEKYVQAVVTILNTFPATTKATA